MKGLVKLHAHPKLRSPIMIAAWPGIGNVATIVGVYLRRELNFRHLGELDAPHFFDPIGVSARESMVESPQFPESNFFYWKNRRGEHDLILFIGDDQPSAKAYDLANCVLDVAEKFQVERIYTCAAAMTRMHHTEQPRVWGVGTTKHAIVDLKKWDLVQSGEIQIAGLNGLLLGVAKDRGVEGICLLGEVPVYATRIQNPIAALAVLKVLTKILSIEIDLADLARMAVETGEKLKQMAAQAMEEYIDFFTEPIWERGEETEEEEGDEEG